jgi:hypothetical protein
MKKLTSSIFLFLCIITTSMAQTNTMQTYCNHSYNFCMSYPASLVEPQPESPKGDGREFTAKQGGAKITTWGNEAPSFAVEGVADFDPKEEVKKVYNQAMEGKKITYKVLKDSWFVISGTAANGTIFYQKTMLKGVNFITVLLEYPESEKSTWNLQCGKVANSLKFN